jgi:hypothetical protein
MHIFKYFKCFTIQIFYKFKYDVPHIFSLLFLNTFLSSNIFHNIKNMMYHAYI